MPETATPPTTKSQRRRRALDPWIEQLRRRTRVLAAGGADSSKLIVRAVGETLTVDPWAHGEIRRALELDGADEAEKPALVLHAVALKMKIESDRERLERSELSESQELYAIQAELMLDAAMGLALGREIQRAIDEAVGVGEIAPAKRWTAIKNLLGRAVTTARRLLAESERQRADALSDQMTDQPRAPEAAPAGSPAGPGPNFQALERERTRLQRARRIAGAALAQLPSRTELLTAALAVVVAVWLGFVKLPEHLATPPPVLTAEDFPRTDAFVEVEARPPSLYVTLDTARWSRLTARERDEILRSTAAVLDVHDYTGALFKTADGRPVARWLTLSGVTALEDGESRTREGTDRSPEPSTAFSKSGALAELPAEIAE